MRDRSKSADLLKSFRETRKQIEKSVGEVPVHIERPHKSSPQRGSKRKSSYEAFCEKYERLETEIDDFKSPDLMYFFQRKAAEVGIKYVIANMNRDLGVFKKLLSNYTPREICLMIEFIFNSNQDYLDKAITQPTVLISGFCNKIYRDSMLWVEDKYSPDSKPKNRPQREWVKNSSNSAKIGDWEDE